ncbi:MAG: L,D-transpeptidase family protein [Chloroflexota bacterium]
MIDQPERAQTAIEEAKKALQRKDLRSARRWAEQAVSLAPDDEDAWLLLAALAAPRASITYLKRALKINPKSTKARRGMQWAIKRLRREDTKPAPKQYFRIYGKISPSAFTRPRPAMLPWLVLSMVVIFGLTAWFSTPTFSMPFSQSTPVQLAQVGGTKATRTKTPTPTPTNTPTPTPTNTPTATPIPTNTPLPTATFPPQPTAVPPTPVVKIPGLPPGVQLGERWIDIDLSKQRLYAYQGKNVVKSFIVSTGTWATPTVTGVFRVYVKYRFTVMAGPGYYLPNVPYTMYFYRGYGIHGTYWHNNFGTPMSHGCVNMITSEAGWIFNWSTVGTVVNIHY